MAYNSFLVMLAGGYAFTESGSHVVIVHDQPRRGLGLQVEL